MSTQSQVSERISRSTIPLPVNTGNISGMNRMEEVPSSSIPHTSKSGSPSCDVTPSPTLTSPPSGKEIRKHLFKSIKDIRNIKNIGLLALYLGLCIIVGVIMGRAIEVVAENQSLFVARAIISASLAFPTLSLNKILDVFIRDQFDAGVWARIIHKGKYGEKMTLKKLSDITSSNLSLVSWFNLCRYRMRERDGQDKSIPKSYDNKSSRFKWSFQLLVLLLAVLAKDQLMLLFERAIDIDADIIAQNKLFEEVFIWGELSSSDLARARDLVSTFTSFEQTWTLSPFSSIADQPSPVTFIDETTGYSVYFAETTYNQLRPIGGSGLGTFNLTSHASDGDIGTSILNLTDNKVTQPGVDGFLQFPKWGIRIMCSKFVNPTINIVPLSNATASYVFVTTPVLEELFVGLSLPIPDLPILNTSNVLWGNDVLPSGIDANKLVAVGAFANNGVAHSFYSMPIDLGESGQGWAEIEVLLVRVNTTYTPGGTFPIYGDPVLNANGVETQIGYDAAVCLEVYEPWIVEIFNGTAVPPSSVRLLGPLKSSASQVASTTKSTDGWNVWKNKTVSKGRLRVGENGVPDDMNWTLNSTGKSDAFAVAHDNSVNQMVKDNGRDFWYVPSPLLVSFTDGAGPSGYTELSASRFASARAYADATNALPFLAGSGPLAARRYFVGLKSHIKIIRPLFILLLFGCCALGIMTFWVPTLPLSVPRRENNLLSWLAVLHGDKMGEYIPLYCEKDKMIFHDRMNIREVREKIGDTEVLYKLEEGANKA